MTTGRITSRVDALLAFMQLEGKAEARVAELSGGMERCLLIARASINDLDLILLDEPTTGLDPQAQTLIWRQLHMLAAAGRTVPLTTHCLDKAERLCDRIILVENGRVLDEDSPAGLVAHHFNRQVIELRKPLPLGRDLTHLPSEDVGNAVLVDVANADSVLALLPADATFSQCRANLEDVFRQLTGCPS